MTDDGETRYRKKAPRRKPFGIEQWNSHHKRWQHRQWYATARGRDSALADLKRKRRQPGDFTWDTRYRKIDRKINRKKKP